MNPDHIEDSDCTIDPATLCCTVCGVYHGEQCLDCEGRGFHESWCPSLQVNAAVLSEAKA